MKILLWHEKIRLNILKNRKVFSIGYETSDKEKMT
jgi:hypothetical protein